MPTAQPPLGDGSSVVRRSSQDPPPESQTGNGPARPAGESAKPSAAPPACSADPTEPAVKGLEGLFFDPDAEPSDDSPTVISRAQPRPAAADEVLSGSLRGRRLAHFELIEPIGVGGMAAVIRARDTQLDRPVALKILPPEMATEPESVRRFHQEARAAARLDHENIARVYFCGEDQGLHFIAFEFVEGPNLRTVLERRGRLPMAETIHYLLQIATGLDHAASRGVVHRDIKPSNIIISPNGRAKLVDMGLARSREPQGDKGLTQSGVTLGTFDYISPEQALEPRDADVRSDIYSLGCTFYHVLTGQPPVPEGTAAKKLHHHQHVAPIDPRQLNPDVPDEVAAILGRMMAKEPRDRYQNADRLVQHLIVVAQKLGVSAEVPRSLLFVDAPLPEPPQARPILLAAVAAALLVGLVLVLGQFGSNPVSPGGPAYSPPSSPDVPGPRPAQTNQNARPGPEPPAAKVKVSESGAEKTALYDELVPSAQSLARFLEQNQDANAIKVVLRGDLDLGSGAPGDDLHPVSTLVFRADKVTIEAHSDAQAPPTIRLRHVPLQDTRGILAALVLDGDATLSGLRLVVDATRSQVNMAAVQLRKGKTFEIRDCEFLQADPPPESAPGDKEPPRRLTSVVVDASQSLTGMSLDLQQCYFARLQDREKPDGPYRGAQDAVKVIGRAEVKAVNCAFAPHATLFRLAEGSSFHTTIEVQNCSAMASGEWTAFHLEDRAEAQLSATNCLFSRLDAEAGADEGPTDDEQTVLIRQTGKPAGQLRYAGSQNRYHGLTAFWVRPGLDGEPLVIKDGKEFTAAVEKTPNGQDRNSQVLSQSPWQESDPLRILREEGSKENRTRDAFLVNLKLHELRLGDTPPRVIGVERCTWGESYAKVLPPLPDDRRPEVILAGKELIVDPAVQEAGKGVYRSLDQALVELVDVKQRGVIRIRHTGLLPIKPVRLEQAAMDITITPFQGHRPILTLGNTPEQEAFLFRVHDGKLTLEDLEFHLEPRRDGYKTQSVVELIGEGSCTFKDCVVTLAKAGKKVPLAVVKLSDPALAMKMEPQGPPAAQGPGIHFEDCFVRGEGELLRVRASRPFALDARNCLFALAGSCLSIQGNADEVPAGQVSVARMERVTAYLTEHLVRLQARNDVRGLVPLQVRAFDSLFVSHDSGSLINLDGPGTNEEKMKGFFLWDGKHNVYSNFMHLLDQQPPADEIKPRPYNADKWKDYTGERDALFVPRVKSVFIEPPPADTPLARVGKASFKVKTENDLPSYGANLDKLPAPSGPAVPNPE